MKLFILILFAVPTIIYAKDIVETDIDLHSSKNKLSVKVAENNVTLVKILTDKDQVVWSEERLELMDCYGAGNAKKFAEICAAVCLSGEISIIAAMSAGHFASAHEKLGRK